MSEEFVRKNFAGVLPENRIMYVKYIVYIVS